MTAYTFDQIIDFTRTSAATYVANTGFVTQTPASRNLLTYTQEFDNAAWTKSNANAYPFDPAAATLGSELVANGAFDSGTTGWSGNANATLSVVSGTLRVTAIANGTAYATQAITTVPGLTYRITATYVTDAITGNAFLYAGTAAGSGNVGNLTIGSTLGAHTLYFVATGTTTYISVSNSTLGLAGEYMDFDNISVREVIGGLITAPDGTLTGDALVASAGTSAKSVTQVGGSSGVQQTFSVHAKAGASSFVQIWHGAAANIFADFNLATGVVGTVGAGATATITSVGAGWYRCTVTCTPGSANQFRVAMVTSATATYAESWAATGTESLYLWGAQLEAASSASTYTRNVGGVYPPRFDYDPVTLAPRGLLIEEQRTNLLTNSEFPNGLSDAPTRGGNVSISAFSLLPGNTGLAINNTGAVTSFAYKTNFTTVVSTTYTLSAFVRMTDGNAPSFGSSVNTDSANSFALVIAGSAVNPTTYTVTAMGNGFYRVSATVTAASASTNNGVVKYDTNDSRSFTVSGYQLEAGAFATSYIPTVASQVTRTADVATVTGANFSRWFNGTEGSWVAEFDVVSTATASKVFFTTSNGTSDNVNYGYVFNTAATFAEVRSGGATQATLGIGTATPNTTFRAAMAYRANDFAAAGNGGAVSTDTSGAVPLSQSELNLGYSRNYGGLYLNGHLRRIKYYPTRLSNTQLQALTA